MTFFFSKMYVPGSAFSPTLTSLYPTNFDDVFLFIDISVSINFSLSYSLSRRMLLNFQLSNFAFVHFQRNCSVGRTYSLMDSVLLHRLDLRFSLWCILRNIQFPLKLNKCIFYLEPCVKLVTTSFLSSAS